MGKDKKPQLYIASCSFGKDSRATILLALENNEPLDRVVFAEVMSDPEQHRSNSSSHSFSLLAQYVPIAIVNWVLE